jgi:hypothetical protein
VLFSERQEWLRNHHDVYGCGQCSYYIIKEAASEGELQLRMCVGNDVVISARNVGRSNHLDPHATKRIGAVKVVACGLQSA